MRVIRGFGHGIESRGPEKIYGGWGRIGKEGKGRRKGKIWQGEGNR